MKLMSGRIGSGISLCLVLVLLFAFSPFAHAQAPVDPKHKIYPALLQMAAERPDEMIPVIIQRTTRDKRSTQDVEALARHLGGANTRDLRLIAGTAVELPARAVETLARDARVRWISLDAPMVQTGTPVDTSRLISTYIRSIGADRVWNESPHLQGEGITVAVVDSGVMGWGDFKQADGVTSRILTWTHFSNDIGRSADDYFGHGSHVAGIIGGNGALSAGEYIGVAPKVNLVNVKVSNFIGISRTSDVVEALQWISDNKDTYNIRVVNMSLNGAVPESYHTSPLSAAVELLWLNGIVVVVSAGNNGTGAGPVTVLPPANDPFVISVGAVDDWGTADIGDDTLAPFSAYGTTSDGFAKPDLVAPGRNIVSLMGRTDALLMMAYPTRRVTSSNQTTPFYFRMSGTSMAAPMVAGAAALLLQDEPTLTPDQVKYRLMATARPFAGPQPGSTGAGYLDVYAAVHGTTTKRANVGLPVSQLLGTGTGEMLWNSINWNSINWNSINWNSINWNSINWSTYLWDDGHKLSLPIILSP